MALAAVLTDQIERWLPLGFVAFFVFVAVLRRRARAGEDLEDDERA